MRLCHGFKQERGGAGQEQAPPAQPPKVPERSVCSGDVTELPSTTFESTWGASLVSMFFFLTRAPILFRTPRSQLKTHLSQPSLQPMACVHQRRGFWKSWCLCFADLFLTWRTHMLVVELPSCGHEDGSWTRLLTSGCFRPHDEARSLFHYARPGSTASSHVPFLPEMGIK